VSGPTSAAAPASGLLSRALPPACVLVAFITIWYALSYLVLDPARRFLLPPPHQTLLVGLLDPANRLEVFVALWSTTQVALLGLAIAIVVGVATAIVMRRHDWIERSLFPYALLSQTVPILAMVPLIGFWIGFSFTSRVLIVVIVSVFPIITNTLFGLKSAEPILHELFTLHRAGWWTRLRKLLFPGALPAMFTGFRISAAMAVLGAIVADFFFRQGEPGIGRLIDIYRARLQTEQLFTAVALASLLGIAVFSGFGWMGRRLTRHWHASSMSH
jgi:NitT/TauT family transport system permease protein